MEVGVQLLSDLNGPDNHLRKRDILGRRVLGEEKTDSCFWL